MKTINKTASTVLLLAFFSLAMLLYSCSVPVRLTASWSDRNVPPTRFSKVLVLSVGNDLEKRRLGEDNIKAELQKHGITAVASLDEFSPDFAKTNDSLKMRGILLNKQYDGVITIRVLNVN